MAVVVATLTILSTVLARGGDIPSTTYDVSQQTPYACMPVAGALVLAYFGWPANEIQQMTRQIQVRADGTAAAGDLVRVCEGAGLVCKAYRKLSLSQIRAYVARGCAVVVVTTMSGRQHAVSLFHGPKTGTILAADLLRPVHSANLQNLKNALSDGAVGIVIGQAPIPDPGINLRPWGLILLVGSCVGCGVYLLHIRKGVRQ